MPDKPETQNQQNQPQGTAAVGAARAQDKETVAPTPQPKNGNDDKPGQALPVTKIPVNKIQHWGEIELQDRLMVLTTIGILFVAGITGWIFVRQAKLMEAQLDEMKGTGEQTERLITLNAGQLTQVARQVETSKKLVTQMKRSADAAQRSARAAEITARTSEQGLRGYLSMEDIKIDPFDPDKPIAFVIVWKNDGNSQATLTHSVNTAGLWDKVPTLKQCPNNKKPIAPIVVNPHSTRIQTIRVADGSFTKDQLKGLKDNTQYFFFCGQVIYNTLGKEYSFPLCSYKTHDLGIFEECAIQ